MTHVAILGFGVVGRGVAEFITANQKEAAFVGGDGINIKYILDLRDFPSSPFSKRIVHDYSIIANDPEISTVIEVMGGSHPAYEYAKAAILSGKNVITSNKEVVANFGDELLALARENGVCYRFEASVGGGIPALSPIISCVRQNKIKEIRGILNGTTNYILTEMFTYGASFESALCDAQEKGYAERNPAADVEGTDATRKIAILTAIVSGKLLPVDKIYTEGITKIRDNDVKAAAKLGATVKLVARGIVDGKEPLAMVAPFIVMNTKFLSAVSGVYNAIEVIAEPLGDVMFYGQGAGGGTTASAVVGDLVQVMSTGVNYTAPVFEKSEPKVDFMDFVSRHYLAYAPEDFEKIEEKLGAYSMISKAKEIAVITHEMSEREIALLIAEAEPKSHIRVLD